MKVYVLTSRYFDETVVHGVFSTMQSARDAKATQVRMWRANDDTVRSMHVAEFTVDDLRVYQD